MQYIKIFATGGTFDKEFNEIDGKLYFKETKLYDLLKLGRSQLNVKIETLIGKLIIDRTDIVRVVENIIENDEHFPARNL